jgi:hypothetical protein
MYEQREETAAEQIAGRVTAGVHEQQEEQIEIDVVERMPVDLGLQDLRREVARGTLLIVRRRRV